MYASSPGFTPGLLSLAAMHSFSCSYAGRCCEALRRGLRRPERENAAATGRQDIAHARQEREGHMNIAIDGPAGAGKSTIAKLVASKLGSIYVDTGAMYRAIALCLIRKGVDEGDSASIEACLDEADIAIVYEDKAQHVLLNGEDVTSLIRTPEISAMASRSSADPHVRAKLVELQRKLAGETAVVMDGRDIGTVVLPDAELKIYLTASPHVRAVRRYQELKARGGGEAVPSLEEIERDIIARDERDMHREHSPLRKAEDAVEVDSTQLGIEEVAERILELAAAVEAGADEKRAPDKAGDR